MKHVTDSRPMPPAVARPNSSRRSSGVFREFEKLVSTRPVASFRRAGRLHRARQGGFSLVELVVVLSIVLLLVAMLLPSLRKAKTVAEIVRCAANERQQGIAMAAYTSDYSGHYINPWYAETRDPPGRTYPDGHARMYPFPALITDYLPAPLGPNGTWTNVDGQKYRGLRRENRDNAWTCPTRRVGWGLNVWKGDGKADFNDNYGGSYTINTRLFQFTPRGNTLGAQYHTYGDDHESDPPGLLDSQGLRHESRTPLPSSTIAMTDGLAYRDELRIRTSHPMVYQRDWSANIINYNYYNGTAAHFPWHDDVLNVLFLDGHVKGWDIQPILDGGGWSSANRPLYDLKLMSLGKRPRGHLMP